MKIRSVTNIRLEKLPQWLNSGSVMINFYWDMTTCKLIKT